MNAVNLEPLVRVEGMPTMRMPHPLVWAVSALSWVAIIAFVKLAF
jgi:hypothetical protein